MDNQDAAVFHTKSITEWFHYLCITREEKNCGVFVLEIGTELYEILSSQDGSYHAVWQVYTNMFLVPLFQCRSEGS